MSRSAHVLCWQCALALSLSVRGPRRASPAVWHAGVAPLAACLAMTHVAVPRFDPQRRWAPFCDVICKIIWSMLVWWGVVQMRPCSSMVLTVPAFPEVGDVMSLLLQSPDPLFILSHHGLLVGVLHALLHGAVLGRRRLLLLAQLLLLPLEVVRQSVPVLPDTPLLLGLLLPPLLVSLSLLALLLLHLCFNCSLVTSQKKYVLDQKGIRQSNKFIGITDTCKIGSVKHFCVVSFASIFCTKYMSCSY